MSGGALEGTVVLDAGGGLVAGYCTRILAGFGAEVIKVEKPSGDVTRSLPPFRDHVPGPERSGVALFLDGNKKSVTLNLDNAEGVKIFRRLAEKADVVIDSFGVDYLDSRGLTYASLSESQPRLVMTSITPFGQSGPYRDWKSSSLIAYGMSVGGRVEDPVQIGGHLVFYLAGLHAATGILSALYDSRETGTGQAVDISLWESTLMSAVYPAVAYSFNGQTQARGPLLGLMPCKDGHVGVNAYTAEQRQELARFLDLPELNEDLGWSSATSGRNAPEHIDAIRRKITERIANWTARDLFEEAGRRKLPFGLAPTPQDMLEFPQHKARNFFETTEHPTMGSVVMPGAPFKMSETPWALDTPAPALGEHNAQIYGEWLGYSAADLADLKRQDAI